MEIVKRNWKQIKVDLQKELKITDEDWLHTKGQEEALINLLVQKSNVEREQIENKVNEIYSVHTYFDDQVEAEQTSTFQNRPYFRNEDYFRR